MGDIPKFDPSKAAIEDFDPDFASPAEWAAMYRACGPQVVPCFMPGEVARSEAWKRPKLAEWATLQESLSPDATFERWYRPPRTEPSPHRKFGTGPTSSPG